MISESQNHHSCTENMESQEYIQALEDERRKIQVFQRDLPLCLELVTQAIEACKQQLSGTRTYIRGQSECYEQTSSEGPVIEEFISIKKTTSVDEEQSHKPENNNHNNNNDKSTNKLDWLRSVSLWNHDTDPPTEGELPRKVSVTELKGNARGTFNPFKGEKSVGTTPTTAISASSFLATEASSTAETGGNKKEEKEGRSQRKARRSWSPELHRRFLHALQQLGGYHVATPKQIRELMKVDGFTNDEVKSHLQKYRLHTRRPTPLIHNNNNPQAVLQFVVVEGSWVSPPEFAMMGTTAATTGVATPNIGTYAPIAAPAPPLTQAESSETQR